MMKVKDKVQTCGSEELSDTNVTLISTEVSGLKLRVEKDGRMQMGFLVLQEGKTTVSSNPNDIPTHVNVALGLTIATTTKKTLASSCYVFG